MPLIYRFNARSNWQPPKAPPDDEMPWEDDDGLRPSTLQPAPAAPSGVTSQMLHRSPKPAPSKRGPPALSADDIAAMAWQKVSKTGPQ
jgi:hypothetical protein